MLSVEAEYMEKNDYNRTAAAANLAFDLMQDDPKNFKQGYSFDNAVIAASEYMSIHRTEITSYLEGDRHAT